MRNSKPKRASASKTSPEEGNGVGFVPGICCMSLCLLILIWGCYSERTRIEFSEEEYPFLPNHKNIITLPTKSAADDQLLGIHPYELTLVEESLQQGKIAVIVIYFQQSFLKPTLVKRFISESKMPHEIFSVKWDWGDPKGSNPFFNQLGGYNKDGEILLFFPDRSTLNIRLHELSKLRKLFEVQDIPEDKRE